MKFDEQGVDTVLWILLIYLAYILMLDYDELLNERPW